MSNDAIERLRVVAAALVDGAVSAEERAALERAAATLGLDASAVEALLAAPGPLSRPAPGEEDAVLAWLVEVVRVDGQVAPAEAGFVRRVGAAFGRTPEQVDALLAGPAGSHGSTFAVGPFGGALAREGDRWVERVDPALAAALRGAAAGEALAADDAALAPWSVDDQDRVVHRADPGEGAALSLAAVAAAARTVAALHARGRAHGDLRPGTLRARSDGAAALATPAAPLDAPACLRARLAAGAAPIDVAYVAPEVVAGAPATPAADVYSLAALAFHALAGRPPLGQVEPPPAPPDASALPALVLRALSARPDERPTAEALAAALAQAARPAPEVADAGGFELVEGAPVDGALRGRLVGASADAGEPTDRAPSPAVEGAQVSAILMLVLGLGGIFVLVGAIGLAIVLEQAGGPGLLGLLVALTAGAFVGGSFAERRGSPRGGLVLTAVGTQLQWAVAAYVLNTTGLLESSVAWCVVAALVATVTGAMALRRRSTALWVLAALGALVACTCLWSAVGPGGRAFLLAATAAGLLAGGHRVRAAGHAPAGLALQNVGALLLLGVAAQVLDVTGRVDEEGAWALAAGVCAGLTAAVATSTRTPSLWAVTGLQAIVALACLWAALDPTGRGALSAAATAALSAGGHALIARRGRRTEGLVLWLAGGLVAWVAGGHLLWGAHLEEEVGAWLVTAGLITALAYPPALVYRSTLLAALAALDLAVTGWFLGAHLSTGSLVGPPLFTGLVAAVFVGAAALTHARGGVRLAAPAAVVAGLWAWGSAVCGLAVFQEAPVLGMAWPLGLTALACGAALAGPRDHRPIAAGAASPLVAIVPTTIAFMGAFEHHQVGYLQLALGTSLLVIAAAFHAPAAARTPARQVLTILPALVPATFAPFVLCLAACAGREGMTLLEEALATAGRVHETRFAYMASVVGSSGVLVGAAFLFAPRAASRAPYRLLEVAGLLLFFGTFTILSLTVMDDWFYPLVLLVGGVAVIGLGVWQRRAVLVASATVALLLNLWLQYFVKLHDRVPTFGLLLGFGVGLLAFGLLYERRVKRVLPVLREWA